MADTEPKFRTYNRIQVHLTTDPPTYYTPERDPLLPPIPRATELPMSSQSHATSSPERTSTREEAADVEFAGSGRNSNLLEEEDAEEDDFDGIEEVPLIPAVQSAKRITSTKSEEKGEKVSVPSLRDLFSDDEEDTENIAISGGGSKSSNIGQSSVTRPQTTSRQPLSTIAGHGHGRSSPLPALSSSTTSKRYLASDSPASPLPKTPQTDELDLDAIDSWSASPMSDRTKSRRGAVQDAYTSPSPKAKRRRTNLIDLSDDTPPKQTPSTRKITKTKAEAGSSAKAKPKSRAKAKATPILKSKAKAKEKEVEEEEVWDEDDFHDLDFLDDVDLDQFDHPQPSGTGSTSNPSSGSVSVSDHHRPPSPSGTYRNLDPGRAFRPSSTSASTSTNTHPPPKDWHSVVAHRQASPPSELISVLDDISRPDRLRLITELSLPEQDFYRNHWRRGADKGSKKRGQVEEEEYSDEEFHGPQPTEKKKKAPPKWGGSKGRGRGRAAGRGRARR